MPTRKPTPPTVEVRQAALDELFRASASVLDQMFRGRHSPTRMQCVMLAQALQKVAPLVTPQGMFKMQRYVDDLVKVVNDPTQYSPRNAK